MSGFMRSRMFYFLLIIALILIFLPSEGVYAFGAGNIPSYSHMEGKAFRHGDIEDVLGDLAKGAGKGLLGISALGGSKKFSGLDIKRVYFGNWLRDYSQAVDIAGLKKLQIQSIINLCMALGFLAHGYATAEFEVTEERLGVYLPVEHIDNPKGYGEGEDARKYHPKLRGPIDPRELEVDYRTGMKNYIANEDGPWDTSKGHVRKILEQCINMGRKARSTGRKEDEYEALRLLGTALHTLEDFPAHSNFCELALVSLGYHQVFVHIGDQVRVQAPNGRQVAPLVTGTFGGSDFIHSLLGEASDHISSASVSDLTKEFDKARTRSRSTNQSQTNTALRDLIFQIPGGGDSEISREMEGVERIRASTQPGGGGGKRPDEMSPQELHATLWQILKLRDDIMKKIENTIEKIPGLSALIEKITDTLAVFIFTTLEPFMKPILQSATTALQSGSAEVINSHDQYEVFNDPRASDPTHSFLSKDHFGLIMNEPAGNLAKIIVTHSVQMVAKAWDDPNVHARQVIEPILSCMFHPDFHDQSSGVQREMMQYMSTWIKSHPDPNDIARRLSKESVRNHQATRLKEQGAESHAAGPGYNAALQAQSDIGNYFNSVGVPGLGNVFSSHGTGREMSGDNFAAGAAPYGGQSQGHSPIPTSGEASQFFSSGPPSSGTYPSGPSSYYGGGQQPQYPSPQGPPSQHGGVGFPAPSSAPVHTPPHGHPPPLLPPHGAPQHGAPAHGSMYNPSYGGGGGHKKKDSDSDESDDGGYHPGKPKKEKKKKSHKPEAHHQDSARGFPGAPSGFPSAPSGFAEPSVPSFPGGPPSFPSAPGFPPPPGGFSPSGFPPPGGFPQQGGYPQPGGFPQPGYGPPPGPPPMFPGGPGGPGGPPPFPGGPPGGPYGQPPDNNTYPGQNHGQHGGYNPNYGGGW